MYPVFDDLRDDDGREARADGAAAKDSDERAKSWPQKQEAKTLGEDDQPGGFRLVFFGNNLDPEWVAAGREKKLAHVS